MPKRWNPEPYPRLTTPMLRDSGELRPVPWAVALDAAADGLRGRDPWSVGMFSCSKATNEVNYLAQRFARSVLGTNNIDSCNRT